MDPDQALENARHALATLLATEDMCDALPDEELFKASRNLAEAFEALDGWLSKGGYLPADWTHAIRGDVP